MTTDSEAPEIWTINLYEEYEIDQVVLTCQSESAAKALAEHLNAAEASKIGQTTYRVNGPFPLVEPNQVVTYSCASLHPYYDPAEPAKRLYDLTHSTRWSVGPPQIQFARNQEGEVHIASGPENDLLVFLWAEGIEITPRPKPASQPREL